ncbi:MAG: hypothetical protein NTY63_02580 [Candidatus Bipolaricaulota bacterium]|nr:hypothetical protein [Candidatus Bipolaricaulota bacterium]
MKAWKWAGGARKYCGAPRRTASASIIRSRTAPTSSVVAQRYGWVEQYVEHVTRHGANVHSAAWTTSTSRPVEALSIASTTRRTRAVV